MQGMPRRIPQVGLSHLVARYRRAFVGAVLNDFLLSSALATLFCCSEAQPRAQKTDEATDRFLHPPLGGCHYYFNTDATQVNGHRLGSPVFPNPLRHAGRLRTSAAPDGSEGGEVGISSGLLIRTDCRRLGAPRIPPELAGSSPETARIEDAFSAADVSVTGYGQSSGLFTGAGAPVRKLAALQSGRLSYPGNGVRASLPAIPNTSSLRVACEPRGMKKCMTWPGPPSSRLSSKTSPLSSSSQIGRYTTSQAETAGLSSSGFSSDSLAQLAPACTNATRIGGRIPTSNDERFPALRPLPPKSPTRSLKKQAPSPCPPLVPLLFQQPPKSNAHVTACAFSGSGLVDVTSRCVTHPRALSQDKSRTPEKSKSLPSATIHNTGDTLPPSIRTRLLRQIAGAFENRSGTFPSRSTTPQSPMTERWSRFRLLWRGRGTEDYEGRNSRRGTLSSTSPPPSSPTSSDSSSSPSSPGREGPEAWSEMGERFESVEPPSQNWDDPPSLQTNDSSCSSRGAQQHTNWGNIFDDADRGLTDNSSGALRHTPSTSRLRLLKSGGWCRLRGKTGEWSPSADPPRSRAISQLLSHGSEWRLPWRSGTLRHRGQKSEIFIQEPVTLTSLQVSTSNDDRLSRQSATAPPSPSEPPTRGPRLPRHPPLPRPPGPPSPSVWTLPADWGIDVSRIKSLASRSSSSLSESPYVEMSPLEEPVTGVKGTEYVSFAALGDAGTWPLESTGSSSRRSTLSDATLSAEGSPTLSAYTDSVGAASFFTDDDSNQE